MKSIYIKKRKAQNYFKKRKKRKKRKKEKETKETERREKKRKEKKKKIYYFCRSESIIQQWKWHQW